MLARDNKLSVGGERRKIRLFTVKRRKSVGANGLD